MSGMVFADQIACPIVICSGIGIEVINGVVTAIPEPLCRPIDELPNHSARHLPAPNPSAILVLQEVNMLSLRLPEELEDRLEKLAETTGRTKTYYAREAIESSRA
jgi:hypothetical protein